MKNQSIYLDYAAATPLDPEALKAMTPFFSENFYNPSATYLAGRQANQSLSSQRVKIAFWLGARPAEIILTSGATEANNLAIAGVGQQFPEGEMLVSSIEHESVLAPAAKYGAKLIPVTNYGVIDTAWLAKKITSRTVLLSVMMVNNEVGSIQPVKEIGNRNAQHAGEVI